MQTRLTEFSYGYCVTEEFTNGAGAGLKAAPYFPSLYAEGKKGGGFDVRIGSAVFFQFKLSHELTRRSAKEFKKRLLTLPFFRFWLHRRDLSDQHEMLIELENQAGNQVYYIAPAFSDVDALDSAYTSKQVIDRSAMFSPKDIGLLPDDKDHRVSFSLATNTGWFLSEPRKIPIHKKAAVLAKAHDHHLSDNAKEARQSLDALTEQMINIVRERRPKTWDAGIGKHREPADRLSYLARTQFGVEVFLPAEPRTKKS